MSTNSNIILEVQCPVNDDIEDTEHFLLLCNSFGEHRCSLLAGVDDVLEDFWMF